MNFSKNIIVALSSTLLLAACSDAAAPGQGIPNVGGAGGLPAAGAGSAGAPAQAGAGAGGSSGANGANGGASGSPAAGAAGTATAGSAGSAGAGSAGAAGAGPVGGGIKSGSSTGCGKDVADPIGEYKVHDLTVKGTPRKYWTKLPTGYDKSKPWPIVFYGPGCGLSSQKSEDSQLDASTKSTAILVFMAYNAPSKSCFETGIADSPDPVYFGQALDEVQAGYCTDKGKVFVSGYSSGGWFANLLSCTHGDRIRAIGTVAGGLTAALPATCKGSVSGIAYAGLQDSTNPITKIENGKDTGSGAGRDRLLAVNGCTNETADWDPKWPFCKVYNKCKAGYPVVWCAENAGHSKGGTVSSEAFWKFWSSLPAVTD